MALILVVEDDPTIAGAVAERLRSEGFQVEIAADGPSGVQRADEVAPDLVLLDLMLPGLDGVEVCKRIHRVRPTPVIMLTARDDEADLLVGLAIGADDYITKPFSMRELVARVRTVLRRVEGKVATVSDTVQIGELRVDPARRQVHRLDVAVGLTPTEFDLLACLISHQGAVRTREQLLAEIWGYRDGSGVRTVDSHIRSLRCKVGDDVIRTVHGVGYALGPTN